MIINIPISVGELLDRISILQIKSNKIKDKNKLLNINKELSSMEEIVTKSGLISQDLYFKFLSDLFETNSSLWQVEEELRALEKVGSFKEEFIEHARSVYKLNDHRAKIKKDANIYFKSEFIEEKSYENNK